MPGSISELIEKAEAGAEFLKKCTQEQLDRLAYAVVRKGADAAESLAKLAVEETGMGHVASKVKKNLLATEEVWEYAKSIQTTGIINRDLKKGLIEIAVPKGIIAAILPVTNPTSTTLFKTIIALKTGNPIIFSPSRRARECVGQTIEVIQRALKELDAPEGLVSMIKSSKEATLALLSHPRINLILATGGTSMCHAAYSSGNPALGVGAANVPAYVHQSADLNLAARHIVESQHFDYGLICASEQNIVVDRSVAQAFLASLERHGAHVCNEQETVALARVLRSKEGLQATIGQAPAKIASLAGFSVAGNCHLLVAPAGGVGPEHPLSQEKLAPILGLYEAESEDEAHALCLAILNYGGLGHSFAIHASDPALIERFALSMPASRILVNTSSSLGGVGQSTFLVPSLTLGCGGIGGNASSNNVNVLDLIEIRRVAWGKTALV
jgi:acyl-CoA reductase-like NAD-dependent aldehyde dehydrogenase